MRHRMVTGLGLGNPTAELMANNWPTDRRQNSLVRRCLREAVDLFFTEHVTYADGTSETYAWCDFGIDDDELMIGQEPAYQYEHLKLIVIRRNKDKSYWQQGVAWGAWGSGIASNHKCYDHYKRNSKFTRFVDRWHPLIFPEAA